MCQCPALIAPMQSRDHALTRALLVWLSASAMASGPSAIVDAFFLLSMVELVAGLEYTA